MPEEYPKMTVQEFKLLVERLPSDHDLIFSNGLSFYRFKQRDEKLIQLEFGENIYRDKNGDWCVDSID
ncbi:hypothetical protein [Gimesia panareensis]|uniref:Uncharacterized protein n=1 Tax=Gimesia panareensis TaxID=2527978 RepID=A0A518FRV9_9PLAN|nr:hypothetical protein [Gimesia panareensis]QDU51206.1 hypothetical protein Pan110_35700 [Gimesia panareensis]QDV19072.1 hypothetical protein Pan153_37350 [Gimesia panareensis]